MQPSTKLMILGALFLVSALLLFSGFTIFSKKMTATLSISAKEYLDNPPRTWPGLILMILGIFMIMAVIAYSVILFA